MRDRPVTTKQFEKIKKSKEFIPYAAATDEQRKHAWHVRIPEGFYKGEIVFIKV